LSASRDSATGAISLRWPPAPGQRYRVEYKNDLNAAVWVPLQDTIVADDEMITVKDNFGGGSQRFYRIVLAE
jgi:hypothetical protein